MCGIGGILARDAAAFPHAALRDMSRQLQHRGPDDHGFLLWSGEDLPQRSRDGGSTGPTVLGLVHRRLSIIDLTTSGWQPMNSHDRRYDIVFNGEIYNHIELRQDLEAEGERFTSSSDTEVLLAAWALWGTACLPRLVGMFAFAVVDWQQRCITLVRDRFGIKPLYYSVSPQGFAFASEMKALLPIVGRNIAPQPLYRYLMYGLTDIDADTLIADIRQLPPASFLQIGLDRAQPGIERQYWQVPQTINHDLSFDSAACALRNLLIDSVRLHMRSDVPVGACLSGGLDSSAIVMAMRAAGGRNIDLHTFTYVAAELRAERGKMGGCRRFGGRSDDAQSALAARRSGPRRGPPNSASRPAVREH